MGSRFPRRIGLRRDNSRPVYLFPKLIQTDRTLKRMKLSNSKDLLGAR